MMRNSHVAWSLVIAAAGLVASMIPARAAPFPVPGVMSVCTRPDGTVDAAHMPGDAGCPAMRPIEPGEIPNYYQSNFGSNDDRCPWGGGPIAMVNVPIVRNGITRDVSVYTHRNADTGCRGPEVTDHVGTSIQSHDDAYGFIMGSWSERAFSYFFSSGCEDASSPAARFYRGWVLAPNDMTRRGWGIFAAKLGTDRNGGSPAQCPARYNHGFTAWAPAMFTYRSGRTFASVVTDHYASAARDGRGPGPAEQFERTYWTGELGWTRWEKWARDDWRNPHSGEAAADLSEKLRAYGTCNAPFRHNSDDAPGLSVRPPARIDRFAETHIDPGTGERHVWFMTLCEDYTNLVLHSPARWIHEASDTPDPVFWK